MNGSWSAALRQPPPERDVGSDASAVCALEGDVVVERLANEVGDEVVAGAVESVKQHVGVAGLVSAAAAQQRAPSKLE